SQNGEQKDDLKCVFDPIGANWKGFDYVSGWFCKAASYSRHVESSFSFVSTNSICQGKAVAGLWPSLLGNDLEIFFANRDFKWTNLASHNAGVIVSIIGVRKRTSAPKLIFTNSGSGLEVRSVENINAYLLGAPNVFVEARNKPISARSQMVFGNMPIDGGHLSFSYSELEELGLQPEQKQQFFRRLLGGAEFVRGQQRFCLWLDDVAAQEAKRITQIAQRLDKVQNFREASNREATKALADTPHKFGWIAQAGCEKVILFPRILSERREFITVGYEASGTVTTDQAYVLLDAPHWNLAVLSSRIHRAWIDTVCGKLKTDLRYSNTLGWNTFPVPNLTEKNKEDLTRCAEDILLAREAHFPATIADLYDPEKMPADLRAAHDRNDETLERIYIGRRFRNDTERLEKLFELYTRMTKKGAA
ncbi:MAG: lactate dehydrogenase, partial [Planctomycetes bacterium]|nr:lactate dehydrogenase [Planctomycetota bacterium]